MNVVFLENTVCKKWTKVLLETVHTNPTSPLVSMLRQIFERKLSDQSFVNSHLDLIFNTLECLICTYLEKSQDGECRDQEELSQTWKLVLNYMIDSHDNKVMKRCSLVVTNYLQITGVDIEHVESAVDQFIEDFSLCTKQNTLPIKFLNELIKCANSIDHSKAIKCCELASYIDGSLFYTGNIGNYIDTSDECFDNVYALYSHMYVFTKQILKFFNEHELPNQLENVDEEFVNIMADVICNVNVVVHLLKYFSNVRIHKKKSTDIFIYNTFFLFKFRENIVVKSRMLFSRILKLVLLYSFSRNQKM